MEAVALSALATIVEHDHARVLEELVRENRTLRGQLEQQRLQLEQQRLQLAQQHLRMSQEALAIAELRNTVIQQLAHIARLRCTISWAAHDVQMGEIETAEQRLMGYFDDEAAAADYPEQ